MRGRSIALGSVQSPAGDKKPTLKGDEAPNCFDEVSPSGSVCDPNGDPCIGGFARLYTAIMQARAVAPDALLLNGGDTFQGTVWYNFLRWTVCQHFMNLLPHDAHVLGNHEFDHGVEGLVPYLDGLAAPMLGANVNATFEPELQRFLQNHIIVERKGRKIGIIGILLRVQFPEANEHARHQRVGDFRDPWTLAGPSESPGIAGKEIAIAGLWGRSRIPDGRRFSAPIGNVIMEDEVEAVNREAAILKEQGVDIIIVLSHVGFDSDRRIAANVVSDVDIIVGAHSHTLLYTGTPPNGDTPASDYPTVVTQANGHRMYLFEFSELHDKHKQFTPSCILSVIVGFPVLIVQASCYTRYLGNIKLFIDDAGIIQSWSGQPVFLGTSIVQDPYIMELLEPWREQVDAIGKEVLGHSKITLNRSWCASRECNMGSWACDGFIHQLKELARNDSWGYAHVCLINSGGLRVQINPGVITTEALLMAMPFENSVQVYDLRGEHLLEALEFSVGVTLTPGDFRSGRMLQVAGLRVVFNASAPAGSRVASARVRCIDCDVPRYEPLQLDATYRIVSQNYIGDGGGGYTMLDEHRTNVRVLSDPDYVVLQHYLRFQDIVTQDLDGRIQIIE
ncbi:Apyrase [Eumeta japonica]|uniref:apyrase n=1 Tax=Eumeta variegata TaxID=151549 RepID=A0A4C1VN77_EUMVA|nr:Apyrase [Eumeta japonica]